MSILIVDGQGGGIGKAIVEKLKAVVDVEEFICVGTNSIATTAFIKAGAKNVATGENAVVFNCENADIIVGSIGIIAANSMLGELTPKMAEAISKSKAYKILIPLNRCHLQIVSTKDIPLPQKIDEAIKMIVELRKGMKK